MKRMLLLSILLALIVAGSASALSKPEPVTESGNPNSFCNRFTLGKTGWFVAPSYGYGVYTCAVVNGNEWGAVGGRCEGCTNDAAWAIRDYHPDLGEFVAWAPW